jgi:hypothetical protein
MIPDSKTTRLETTPKKPPPHHQQHHIHITARRTHSKEGLKKAAAHSPHFL